MLADPLAGLFRIADRVQGAVVEVNAASKEGPESGLCRAISSLVVFSFTPVMSRRRPRPRASRSTASAIRSEPPVNATMPSTASGVRCSALSRLRRKMKKPAPSSQPDQHCRGRAEPHYEAKQSRHVLDPVLSSIRS